MMISNLQPIEILKEAGALLEGHFLLTSGRHSNRYVQCAQVFKNARYSEMLCRIIADCFEKDGVTLVIGPAMGAIQMAYEVSRMLGCNNFFGERQNGKMTLRRGFFIPPEARVLIVEDVVTTGGSVREIMDLVTASGATIVGVGAIADRTGGNIDFSVPFHAALSLEISSWEESECPLCRAGSTAIKPGSRGI